MAKAIAQLSDKELDEQIAAAAAPKNLSSFSDADLDKQILAAGGSVDTDYAEAGKAFGANAANEFALGYGPQIVGGVQSLLSPEEGDYAAKRDAVIKNLEEFKAKYPKASMAGQVAGGVGGAFATAGLGPELRLAGMAGKAASSGKIANLGLRGLRSAIQAGTGGLIQGAVYNPGDKEGVVAPAQLEERAIGAGTGALFGGALGGLGQIGGAAASKLGQGISKKASESALQVFKPTKGAFKKIGTNEADYGKIILKKNLLTSNPEDLLEDVIANKKQSGAVLGEAYEQLFQGSPRVMNKAEIANEVLNELAPFPGVPGSIRARSEIEELLREFSEEGGGSLDLRNLQKVKKKIRKSAGKEKNLALQELTVSEKVNSALYKKLNDFQADAAEDIVGVVKGEAAKKALQEQRKEYAILKELERLARDKLAGSKANRSISLTDTIVGVGGLGVGASSGNGDFSDRAVNAALVGIALGGGNKVLRQYGKPISIKAINSFAKSLESFGGNIDKLQPKQKALAGDLIQRGRQILEDEE